MGGKYKEAEVHNKDEVWKNFFILKFVEIGTLFGVMSLLISFSMIDSLNSHNGGDKNE